MLVWVILTQEKIIQELGRIGRNNIQQDYSIRFRYDEQIKQLFKTEAHKLEVVNMNRLFNSNKVVWDGVVYTQVPDDVDDEQQVQEEEEA